MHSWHWLDDGETVNYGEYLLDKMSDVVTSVCKKNCADTLYADSIAKVIRDIPDLEAIRMLEELLACKREVRALVHTNSEAGLNTSDRADEQMARLKSLEVAREDEVTRLSEVE